MLRNNVLLIKKITTRATVYVSVFFFFILGSVSLVTFNGIPLLHSVYGHIFCFMFLCENFREIM